MSVAVEIARADEGAAVDGYVRAHAEGSVFHRPAWIEAVARGTGQRGLMLTARRGGAIVGVLPLTEVRSRLFGRALVSSGFGVGGGVLADDAAAAAALSAEGWRHAGARGFPSLELRGGSAPDDPAWHAQSGHHAGFARPLAASDEAELAAVPRKQRAEIRKALAAPLTVEIGRDEAAARAHYRVYAESVHNLGTPVFPRRLFDAMRAQFGEDADILTVRHEGKPVASVLSLYHNGTVLPYWGGGTWGARALRANERLYFALMRHARARGCARFDFGRSKLGTGAFAYKKNWGFEPEPLTYWMRTAEGHAPRAINPLDPKYRLQIALWKKLPLWLATRAGPLLARGLG
ncbi:FemAB family XrtA/PEP-CTERM system-associated protein [Sphingomonas morindae]|uniref:FemAB family PEP-CTERM system-associated protein n=1 Tax=Sphingomonas morindae TaxID=1541170 RepID=A0ABY4X5J5_9SPHN|nr:FemAB family XrtA/PEP-CTERM system-associated protein [Sphingomonas morindae]USI72125.1 FemAB family PEP-CTERM system-associated protein [Sphingomonas morindae]